MRSGGKGASAARRGPRGHSVGLATEAANGGVAAGESDAERAAILDRLLCEGEDPATCFVQEDGWPTLDGSAAGAPAAPTDAEIEALLRDVLAGLEAHDEESLRRAQGEMDDERAQEMGWFGAADHILQPSIDLYTDPLTALTSRPNLYLDLIDPRDFDYPIVVNSRVQDWMVYFLTRGRSYFVRWLARAERYVPLIVPRLKEAGLPSDLVYQAMIESGFNPYATSRAAAVGVWQFIASTGRMYDLDSDWWVDQRRDPVMATGAAIRFMGDLYKQFGKWELASAAYNAGPGKISKAIRMYETDDYWELCSNERSYLRAETKNYVPKIIAAAILGKYAARYGLDQEKPAEHRLALWDYDVVQVPEATDLSLVAKLSGAELEAIEAMNPALRRGYTPPGIENWPLNVPKGKGEQFLSEFEKIPDEERVTFVRHTVKKGDSIGRIASKYGVPDSAILKMNGIKDARRLKAGQSLLIPVRPGSIEERELTHIVAKGETLGRIGERYGLSVDELKSLNGLKGDTISIGQKLKVVTTKSKDGQVLALGDAADSGSRSKSGSGSTGGNASGVRSASWHTVSSGDTLSQLAVNYGISVAELCKLNGISERSVLKVGERLRVGGDSAGGGGTSSSSASTRTASYTVRSGDTVSTIAERHGLSSKELMALNGMRSTRIYAGQELKVPAKSGGGEASGTASKAPSSSASPSSSRSTSTSTSSSSASTSYTVVSGDTLGSIAEKYDVSISDLQSWNGISGSRINVGQKLMVRRGSSGSPPGGGGTSSDSQFATYKVRSGDSLWSIAQAHGVSVDDLKRWNGLRGSRLDAGQRLKIERR
jgi:membrane-bound lytic murein transglycosylase D